MLYVCVVCGVWCGGGGLRGEEYGWSSNTSRPGAAQSRRSRKLHTAHLASTLNNTLQSEAAEAEDGEGDGDGEAAARVAVDNGDAALLLLRALAAQDDAVNAKLKGEGGLIATRSCVVM